MDRPWLKFYTRDYLNHKELNRCSIEAKGLWPYMLCLMHEGTPYGHLADKAGPITEKFLAAAAGISIPRVRKLLGELEANQVCSRTIEGVVFSRRMVDDEAIRLRRAAGGSASLNHPNVPRPKDTYKDGVEGSPPNGFEGILKGGHPPHARVSRALTSDSDSTTQAPEIKSLYSKYRDFIEVWTQPDDEGHVFTCGDVDLGCQVWITLVDSGVITEKSYPEVLSGLDRHRRSEKWREGYVLSVPAFLGWSKNGTPAAPRWNDRPKPAPEKGEY